MTGIFHGKNALRYKYADMVYTELVGITDITNALMIANLNAAARVCNIVNDLDVAIVVSVVHPDAVAEDVNNRLVLLELAAGRSLNNNMLEATSMNIEPGTKIFIHLDPCAGAAPTCGKVRLIHWG